TPLKKINLDMNLAWASGGGVLGSVLGRLYRYALKSSFSRLGLLTAACEVSQARLMSAFGLSKERVQVTGYPRIDRIIAAGERPAWLPGGRGSERLILYAPTWRESAAAEAHLWNGFDTHRWKQLLEEW